MSSKGTNFLKDCQVNFEKQGLQPQQFAPTPLPQVLGHPNLSQTAKLVYGYLAYLDKISHKKGKLPRVSLKKIGEQVNRSVATVKRALFELKGKPNPEGQPSFEPLIQTVITGRSSFFRLLPFVNDCDTTEFGLPSRGLTSELADSSKMSGPLERVLLDKNIHTPDKLETKPVSEPKVQVLNGEIKSKQPKQQQQPKPVKQLKAASKPPNADYESLKEFVEDSLSEPEMDDLKDTGVDLNAFTYKLLKDHIKENGKDSLVNLVEFVRNQDNLTKPGGFFVSLLKKNEPYLDNNAPSDNIYKIPDKSLDWKEKYS